MKINAADAIALALGLLKGVTAATPGTLDDTIVNAVGSAIQGLEAVHGTPVTKGQLEALRITPQW